MARERPKAPLSKGGWQKSLIFDWGIVRHNLRICRKLMRKRNISLQQSLRAALRRPTSLYTREALVQC